MRRFRRWWNGITEFDRICVFTVGSYSFAMVAIAIAGFIHGGVW